MISLREGYMTALLPGNLGGQPEMQAFAYALHRQVEKLLDLTDGAMLYSHLERVPEPLLDYLAAELRTPCYDMAGSVEVKRTLILQTVPYYMLRGTTHMVNTILATLYGDGRILEFWECDLPPHYFKLHVRGAAATARPSTEFADVLEQVKRKSQWLAAVEMEFDPMQHALRLGGVMGSILTTPVPEVADVFDFSDTVYMGGTAGAVTSSPIPEEADVFGFRAVLRAGGAVGAVTSSPLPERPDAFDLRRAVRMGGGGNSITTMPIPEI